MLGGLFIAVTLLLPRGIVGTWQWWRERGRAARDGETPSAPEPAPRPAE
jgi:urea transport system permease protein